MSDSDGTDWYQKEMQRLDRAKKQLNDQYNGVENNSYNEQLYTKLINSKYIEYAPTADQLIGEWLLKADIYKKMGAKTSWERHVNGPKGAWYSHIKDPRGCFMCDDMRMINVFHTCLKHIAHTNPEYTL